MEEKSQVSFYMAEELDQKYPLVSVILDNYNYGRFLAQAIESVFAQTYTHIELIVVDDGSTDNSREVIESYGDRLTAVFQTNQGQAAAFSTGIKQAKGEIVCLLDSDDYFHPEKIAKVVAAFAQHPQWIQIAHCWISVNTKGKVIGSSTSNLLSQGNIQNLLLQWGKYASGITSALAYRRWVLEKVLPAPNDCVIDSYLNVVVPFYGEVGCLNQPLMYYRIHGKNIRAYCKNTTYLRQEREYIAQYLNQEAKRVGKKEIFTIEKDVDYRVYRLLELKTFTLKEALTVIILSLRESIAIGRSWKDTFVRLMSRSLCVLFPQEGILVMGYGLRGYARYKLLGKKLNARKDIEDER